MNCYFNYLVVLALCVCSVFSNTINKRGNADITFPANNFYYNAFGVGEWEYDQPLSNCRLNVDRRTVYCDDNKNHLRLAFKVRTNAKCSWGTHRLTGIKHWTTNSKGKFVQSNNLVSRKCSKNKGSTHHHFDFTFNNGCVFNGEYACKDVTYTKV